jgi:hypothetical protein
MTSMRANSIKQAGWMTLLLLALMILCASGGRVLAAEGEDLTFDNLDVIDTSLSGKLAVLRVGSDIGGNKLLSVWAGMRNKTGHALNLEIQTIYKDTYGSALNSGSWIPFTLKAHEEKEYHSSAISELATDFLVRVRTASPSH